MIYKWCYINNTLPFANIKLISTDTARRPKRFVLYHSPEILFMLNFIKWKLIRLCWKMRTRSLKLRITVMWPRTYRSDFIKAFSLYILSSSGSAVNFLYVHVNLFNTNNNCVDGGVVVVVVMAGKCEHQQFVFITKIQSHISVFLRKLVCDVIT